MQTDVFQTLADPTRLRIVEVLSQGEHAVNDLVRAVDIDQSGVTRHLRILGEAGFVKTSERPHHSFGNDLVGETWELAL